MLLLLYLRAPSRLGRSLGEPPTDSSDANNRRALGTWGLEQATLPLPTTESEGGLEGGEGSPGGSGRRGGCHCDSSAPKEMAATVFAVKTTPAEPTIPTRGGCTRREGRQCSEDTCQQYLTLPPPPPRQELRPRCLNTPWKMGEPSLQNLSRCPSSSLLVSASGLGIYTGDVPTAPPPKEKKILVERGGSCHKSLFEPETTVSMTWMTWPTIYFDGPNSNKLKSSYFTQTPRNILLTSFPLRPVKTRWMLKGYLMIGRNYS